MHDDDEFPGEHGHDEEGNAVPEDIEGLAAFGESSAPLLYKGRQVEVLRFSKPGLIAKPPVGDAFVVRESKGQSPSILLVLENPSTFAYESVRARLRFDNQDVCLFAAENFGQEPPAATKLQSCDTKVIGRLYRADCYHTGGYAP